MLARQLALQARLREVLAGQVPAQLDARLAGLLDAYVADIRATVAMAAVDAGFGTILMLQADAHFAELRAALEALVQDLDERRQALVAAAVADSARAERLLIGLFLVSTLLTLLGSGLLGRAIARPLVQLTAAVRRLGEGDTTAEVPGADRRDEVGALARAVEASKADAAALRRREAELAETNRRFDTALDNMSQGLCMLDAGERLVVANRRFSEVLGLPAARVRPGMTWREVIGLLAAAGNFPGRHPAEVHAERRARLDAALSGTLVEDWADGRTIASSFRAMPAGGWVLTLEDISDRRRAEARIAHMAHHDALTGLPNRILLHERIDQALIRAGRGCAVLCLDLDRFKAVNDTLGHPVGDALLRAVADRLTGVTRQGDTVARLGGDEFAILRPDPRGPEEAAALAGRIIAALAEPFEVAGHTIACGTSIGIAVTPAADTDALIRDADTALYRAKAEGRGRCRLFEPEMNTRLQQRRRIELDLRGAQERGELELWYQPLIGLRSGRVTGVEAMLRWRHPSRGLIQPAEFIPVAEETGLIEATGARRLIAV